MSYEEMLALGEKLGKVRKGYTEEKIKTIPKTKIKINHDEHGNAIK